MKMMMLKITPQTAKDWLEENTCNRKLRPQYVKKLAAEILAGKWIITGDAIRFSENRLIDGQHRLHAIVEAGVDVETVVMFDLPDEAFDRIDQNKTRTAADILLSHGVQNPTACNSIYKMAQAYDKGGASLHLQTYDKPSVADVLHALTELHKEAASIGHRFAVTGALPASVLGTCYFLTKPIDPDTCEAFWVSVGTGNKDDRLRTNNAQRLRDRLLSHAAASRSSRMTLEHKFVWCVRAWNAERTGTDLSVNGLKFVAGDPIPRFV
jgi:hypothetical protein